MSDAERIRELENEVAALKDAIQALKDMVDGKRNDYDNISEILNGALRCT